MAPNLKNPILWIRVMELVLGIVCFALFKQYGYVPCTFESILDLASARCRIGFEIATVAVVSFPLIFIPIFIIIHLTYGTKFDSNIINPLFAFVGFVLFLVAGSVKLNVITEWSTFIPKSSAFTALGVMCIFTSLAFLGDLIYWVLFKSDDFDNSN